MGRQGPVYKPRPNLDWQSQGNCYNITNFLDEPHEGGWTDAQRIRLCRGHQIGNYWVEPCCPVINECLEYALTMLPTDLQHRGLVYGGYTGQQIAKKIKASRKAKV